MWSWKVSQTLDYIISLLVNVRFCAPHRNIQHQELILFSQKNSQIVMSPYFSLTESKNWVGLVLSGIAQ